MEDKNALYEQHFTKQIIKWGRITNLISVPLCFIPAIVMSVVFHATPAIGDILSGWFLIFSIFGIYAIVEPVSYFPVLGLAGTYMSFLAGNIGNMRVPCSAIAQEAVGVEPGSKRAELVSTLGIAGSIITNLIIVSIAAVAGAAIMAALPPAVSVAFKYVSTGIFAATFTMYALKKPVLAVWALFIGLTMLNLIVSGGKPILPTFVMIPISVFSTIGLGFYLNSLENKKAKK